MAFGCPSCSRPPYNRRQAAREFRGAAVLEKLLLTPKQWAALDGFEENEPRCRSSSGFGEEGWAGADGAWLEFGDCGAGK